MAQTAVEVLFDRHRDGVFRYLRRVLGQTEAAQDLTQEVFLRLTRTTVPDAEPLALRAWTFTIARNLARNHVRDGARRPALVELTETPTAASQETGALIREALAALPESEREIFLLREKVGLSYDEIADACGVTPDAVRSRLHRARQQLRTALGPVLSEGESGSVRLTLPR